MLKYLSLFLISLYFSAFIFSEQPIIPYITSENDTLSLVGDLVDAYNGKLVQKNLDIQIQGSDPFELNRYYDGGHHFESEIGYGVGLSCPLLLAFDPEGSKQNVRVEQRAGFEIPCTVQKLKGSSKKSKHTAHQYSGKVDPDFFKCGYTNCCESLLKGDPSLLSLYVEGDDDNFTVTFGNGTKRYYTYFRDEYPTVLYRLIREDKPNGNHIHYSYVNDRMLDLKRIWMTNPNQSLILNWVDFSYTHSKVHLRASNGQTVCFHQKLKTGTAKNNSLLTYSSIKFSQNILEKVTGIHLPTTEYNPLARSHYTHSLFSTKEIRYANGRCFTFDYDNHERIKKVWQSGVPTPLYTFDYHPYHTIVIDANGGKQSFHYNHRRLIKHTQEDCVHLFDWDDKGQLVKQILADCQERPVIEREYIYNTKGSITTTKVKGNIRHSQSKDVYEIRYLL